MIKLMTQFLAILFVVFLGSIFMAFITCVLSLLWCFGMVFNIKVDGVNKKYRWLKEIS
jgi:hypothetical protein